ncbi:hypothetical protein QFZ75_002988 [Streptomyces sp. V3I8]|uniref:hypothetical protein n=1 Tax=Streptomyces sp. V3I8 TaxID=3042279 RepID=UPI00277EB4B0|nr:hypothetical protein [Streptomyces sp. V3I8]MDQ1036572.1 hypothetical protein [Streptomyces sp. V3I8]
MSLVELIGQADELGLAAGGLACLDRCVPLLGGDDEILRPLWASLAGAEFGSEPGEGDRDWGEGVEQVRAKLYVSGVAEGDASAGGDGSAEGEAVALAHRMLGAAPVERTGGGLRAWSDACSVGALRIHRLLDGSAGATPGAAPGAGPGAVPSVTAWREDRARDMSPLVAAELRRQIGVLEVVSAHGPAGLRQARELTTEGRRVLRAVVSRRARGRV